MPIFGNFDESQTRRKQASVLHHFKACELELSKCNLKNTMSRISKFFSFKFSVSVYTKDIFGTPL